MDIFNLVSFAGIFALMAIAWGLSAHPSRVNWRCVVFGVGLQLALGAVVFLAPHSREVFLAFNDAVLKVIAAVSAGQEFVFGRLGMPGGAEAGEPSVGFVLAFQALPLIVFFAALMGLLYYWRVMPAIIRGFAWLFTRLMRTSGAESLVASSNIFVGIESATTVRPYLSEMTRSEFCTILTAGMATVASSTMAVYVTMLAKDFPNIAGHLISASIMSAPAALVMSKLLLPETGEPLTLGRTISPVEEPDTGAIESIVNGAMAGVKLVVGVVALLIAFLGMIALIDLLLGPLGRGVATVVNWTGGQTGAEWHVELNWSLGGLLTYLMWPLAVLIGIPPDDATLAGEMLGTRLVATEIPAYRQLAAAMAAGSFAHPRSPMVLAYALCGFAHAASLAIFVGGVSALAPQRRREIASVGPRALLAATLACLMTGAVAGTFYSGAASVLGAPP